MAPSLWSLRSWANSGGVRGESPQLAHDSLDICQETLNNTFRIVFERQLLLSTFLIPKQNYQCVERVENNFCTSVHAGARLSDVLVPCGPSFDAYPCCPGCHDGIQHVASHTPGQGWAGTVQRCRTRTREQKQSAPPYIHCVAFAHVSTSGHACST